LSLFVGAMSFAIAKSPQNATVDEHWMEIFWCHLDRGVAKVAVVQLDCHCEESTQCDSPQALEGKKFSAMRPART
jgi:hypothetical protein